jgi:SAM-dependent methyltransferase
MDGWILCHLVHFKIQYLFPQMNDRIPATKDPVGLHTLEVIAKADRFNRWMYDQFKHQLKGEVLEIGSGIGNISKLVIGEGHHITLSDYNQEYCEVLKKKFQSYKNVREVTSIDLLQPDFENTYLVYKEKFDSIFLLNVIEHIKDDELAVKNCQYLLKKDGHLILLAPAFSWLYSTFDRQLGHFKRYALKSLTDLLTKNNFRILSGSYFNCAGIAGWLVFGKILNRKVLNRGEMAAFNKIVPLARIIDKILGRKIGLSIIVTGSKKQ